MIVGGQHVAISFVLYYFIGFRTAICEMHVAFAASFEHKAIFDLFRSIEFLGFLRSIQVSKAL